MDWMPFTVVGVVVVAAVALVALWLAALLLSEFIVSCRQYLEMRRMTREAGRPRESWLKAPRLVWWLLWTPGSLEYLGQPVRDAKWAFGRMYTPCTPWDRDDD